MVPKADTEEGKVGSGKKEGWAYGCLFGTEVQDPSELLWDRQPLVSQGMWTDSRLYIACQLGSPGWAVCPCPLVNGCILPVIQVRILASPKGNPPNDKLEWPHDPLLTLGCSEGT